jgi:hypothetical protein
MNALTTDLVESYASLFIYNWDHYALQCSDGSYRRIIRPLTLDVIAKHLAGQVTAATYVLDAESRCQFAVFDVDSPDGLDRLILLSLELARQDIPTILEASRRGGHLWVLLSEPTPARAVRAWLSSYADELGFELYPKQDALYPGGCGSLMRLPLGIHRLSGHWYPFIQPTAEDWLMSTGEMVAESCAWACANAKRVAVPEEALVLAASTDHTKTRKYTRDTAWASVPDSLYGPGSILAWCRSQDIRAVIGRYVKLNHRGVGSCPFKEHHPRGDLRPSFQVFDDDQRWYCYAWERGGDLFDFLCLYHNLTPKEAWALVREGRLL